MHGVQTECNYPSVVYRTSQGMMLMGTSRVLSVAFFSQVETNSRPTTGRSQGVMRRTMKPDVCALNLRLALWRACAVGWSARDVQIICIGSCASVAGEVK